MSTFIFAEHVLCCPLCAPYKLRGVSEFFRLALATQRRPQPCQTVYRCRKMWLARVMCARERRGAMMIVMGRRCQPFHLSSTPHCGHAFVLLLMSMTQAHFPRLSAAASPVAQSGSQGHTRPTSAGRCASPPPSPRGCGRHQNTSAQSHYAAHGPMPWAQGTMPEVLRVAAAPSRLPGWRREPPLGHQ